MKRELARTAGFRRTKKTTFIRQFDQKEAKPEISRRVRNYDPRKRPFPILVTLFGITEKKEHEHVIFGGEKLTLLWGIFKRLA